MKKVILYLVILCTSLTTVQLNAQCSTNFTSFVDSTSLNAVFITTDSGFTTTMTYIWDLGDGTIDTSNNNFLYQYAYTSIGTYQVCVTATDGICSASFCDSIVVDSVTTSNPCTGFSVSSAMQANGSNGIYNFSANIQGGTAPYTYNWDFGDGNMGTLANGSHTYATYGTYTSSLTVTDANGCTVSSSTTAIYDSCAHIGASFTYVLDSTGTIILSPSVASTQSSNPYIIWSMGNGDTLTGTNLNTTYTYTYPTSGIWVVEMTVVDSACTSTQSNVLFVTVQSPCASLQASIDNQSVNASTVDLTAQLSGGITPYTYLWDLGDGNTSTASSLQHTYSNYGNYTITLSVMDADSCVQTAYSSASYWDCSNVSASFTYTVDTTGDVTFLADTMNFIGIGTITWDLGVGGYYQNASDSLVTYLGDGVYNVCMTVQDSTCQTTYCDTVTVNAGNPSNWGCAGLNMSLQVTQDTVNNYQLWIQPVLTGASSNSGFLYVWNFDDTTSNVITGSNPTHTYSNYGSYEICVLAIDTSNFFCIATACATINIDSLGNFSRNNGFSVTVLEPIVEVQTAVEESLSTTKAPKLYPNPNQGIANLELYTEKEQNTTIQIMNINGQQLGQVEHTLQQGNTILELDLQHLNRGVYFLTYQLDGQLHHLKFVKQ